MIVDMEVDGLAGIEPHLPDPDVLVLQDDAVADLAERDAALGRRLYSIASDICSSSSAQRSTRSSATTAMALISIR